MFVDLFLDPSIKLICNADGDPPVDTGGAPQDPPPADPPPVEGGEAQGAVGETDPPLAKPDWRDKQIDRQHRKLKENEGRLARLIELEAENQRLKELADAATRRDPPPADNQPRPVPPIPQVDEAVVEQRVRAKLQGEQLQEAIQRDYAKEWPEVYENYRKVLPDGIDNAMMDAIMATDDPAYTIVMLGKDPNKIQSMVELSGAKRTAAILKIGEGYNKTETKEPVKRPSDAPPPPSQNPPGGSPSGNISYAGANIYDPNLTDEQFFALRGEQKRNSSGRPWSIGGKGGGATR